MHDLASDVAAVIRAFGGGLAIVVGHALGNGVARVVATDYPGLVKQVVLLAAGGLALMSKETQEAFGLVFNPTLSREERLAAIRSAFFCQRARSYSLGRRLVLQRCESSSSCRRSDPG